MPASLLLLTHKDKILMMKRDAKAKRYPLHWSIFGGHLEEGETPEEALRREIREELSYEVRAPRFLFELKLPEHNLHTFLFREEYDTTQTLVQGEGESMEWLTPTEAKKLKLSPDITVILERLYPT